MTLDIAGKNAVQVTKDPKGAVSPTWSPDGKRLAFVSFRQGQGQIYVLDENGQEKCASNSSTRDRNPQRSPLVSPKISPTPIAIFGPTTNKPKLMPYCSE